MEQPAVEVRFEDLSACSIVPAVAAHNHLTIGTAMQQGAEVGFSAFWCISSSCCLEQLLLAHCSKLSPCTPVTLGTLCHLLDEFELGLKWNVLASCLQRCAYLTRAV